MALKIYLADLVYDTIRTNYTVPLNIGYVAAYAKKMYKDDVDITLIKYPKELEEKIKQDPPDILGLSFYSWNDRLDRFFVSFAKEINPETVTIMGGPNTGIEKDSMREFLQGIPDLDYYALSEGEKPFANLIEAILRNGKAKLRHSVEGCATLADDGYHYRPMLYDKAGKELNVPSPYLMGFLDKFLSDPNMIPLLETNRGCPYGCVYCQWGSSALSKIKTHSLDQALQEVDYVADHSAKQRAWIFADANFGILKRDVDIAQRIQMHQLKNGYPSLVTVWHSKNTSERNIEITKLIGSDQLGGSVAIQSSDKEVLRQSGRGAIKPQKLRQFIEYYKEQKLVIKTDIMLGLPGESVKSHLQSVCDSFSLGFTQMFPVNIRMLAGTLYGTKEYREKYKVDVKFRPIYGAYGIYNGKRVFEMEESIRATKDMTEEELNSMKVIHWFIYLGWNGGIFKNQLRFAQSRGVNPGIIFDKVRQTKNPIIKPFFEKFLKDSMDEWFETQEEMLAYYDDKNYDRMVNGFAKLNFLYIARAFNDPKIFKALRDDIDEKILEEISENQKQEAEQCLNELKMLSDKLICLDPFSPAGDYEHEISGKLASIIFDKKQYAEQGMVKLKISRTEKAFKYCKSYFGDKDCTTTNDWLLFLEGGGLPLMTNKTVEVLPILDREYENSSR